MKSCCILILTYKGQKHLEYLLPTVRACVAATTAYAVRVLIVDNGEHQPTRAWVQKHFSEFEFDFSPVNAYLFSLNAYVSKLSEDYVLILNDDMRMESDVLNHTLPLLDRNEQLFAVNCRIRDWDDTYDASFVRTLHYRRGWYYSIWTKPNDNLVRYTLYGGGGSAVFRTAMFNELEGFDHIYYPAYCEDLDLGHRAWHKGWPTVFCPAAILYHREGATIGEQFKASLLRQKIYKNQVVWMVKNGNKKGFLLWFFILLPYRLLIGRLVSRDANRALWDALGWLPTAIKARKSAIMSDIQLIELLNTEYSHEK